MYSYWSLDKHFWTHQTSNLQRDYFQIQGENTEYSSGKRKRESVRETAWRLEWEGGRGGKVTESLGRGDRKDRSGIPAEGPVGGVPFGVGPL